jgi:hypothetical protein
LYLAGAFEDTGRFEVSACEDAAILETPAISSERAGNELRESSQPSITLYQSLLTLPLAD